MVYLSLVVFYLAGFPFVFFPHSIIQWTARAYAWFYPTERARQMADRLFPLNKRLFGARMSEFILVASEHPEAFVGLVWFVRLLGLIPWITATSILIYIVVAR